jgi:uncharacterized protein
MEILLFLGVGVAAGLSSGLLGIGGGLVVVPALSLMGFSVSHAIGTSVFVVLGNAVIGTVQHTRYGNVDPRMGLGLAAGALPGALLGSYGLAFFPDGVIRTAFVALMLVLAASMARRPRPRPKDRRAAAAPGWTKPAAGGLAGVLAGMFGVGGGLIMVPAQTLLFGVTIHRAIGTSLFVIVLTGTVALTSHVVFGTPISFDAGAWIVTGGLVGAPLGAKIATRLPERPLRLLFALFLLALAVGMLTRSHPVHSSMHRPERAGSRQSRRNPPPREPWQRPKCLAQRRRDERGSSLQIVHLAGDPSSRQAFAEIQQIPHSLYLCVSASLRENSSCSSCSSW